MKPIKQIEFKVYGPDHKSFDKLRCRADKGQNYSKAKYLPSFQLVKMALCPEHGAMEPLEHTEVLACGHPAERVRIAYVESPVNA